MNAISVYIALGLVGLVIVGIALMALLPTGRTPGIMPSTAFSDGMLKNFLGDVHTTVNDAAAGFL